jgi:hypothetical protein
MESIRELPLDQSEKGADGYLPEGLQNMKVGVSGENTIAGGDIRIFAVRVHEEYVEEIPHRLTPARPRGRFLPLRGIGGIQEAVLRRPTFFEHFDGVVVDWRHLARRGEEPLRQEAGWIGRQKLRVFVDLTSGLNSYPDLGLVDNIEEDYRASMAMIEGVLTKMKVLGARDLVVSLHRFAETHFINEQIWRSFEATLRRLCGQAKADEVTVYLRLCLGKPPSDLKEAADFLKRVGAPNFRLAPSTALLLAQKADLESLPSLLKEGAGLWMVSAPRFDIGGRLWDANAPIAEYGGTEALARLLAVSPEVPMVLDAMYRDKDEEYLDALALERITLRLRSTDLAS